MKLIKNDYTVVQILLALQSSIAVPNGVRVNIV